MLISMGLYHQNQDQDLVQDVFLQQKIFSIMWEVQTASSLEKIEAENNIARVILKVPTAFNFGMKIYKIALYSEFISCQKIKHSFVSFEVMWLYWVIKAW